MKAIILLFWTSILIASCNKVIKDNPCDTPVNAIPFVFDISDANNDDLFSQAYLGKFPLDSVQIYHIGIKGIQKDSITIEKSPDFATGKHVYTVSSPDILDQSLAGVKTFYFRRNFNVTDTIVFDETNNLDKGGCNNYELHTVTYNGVGENYGYHGYFTVKLK
jgi:hypothetical protein